MEVAALPFGPPPPLQQWDVPGHWYGPLRGMARRAYQQLEGAGLAAACSWGLRDCAPGAAVASTPWCLAGYAPGSGAEEAEEWLQRHGWRPAGGLLCSGHGVQAVVLGVADNYLRWRAATHTCRMLGGPTCPRQRAALYRAVLYGVAPG